MVRDTLKENQAVPDWLHSRIPVYLAKRTADLQEMQRALASGDLRLIQSKAHNMKGTGASYGLRAITEIGADLEAAAKAGDSGAVQDLLLALRTYMNSVTEPVDGTADTGSEDGRLPIAEPSELL